MKIIRVLAPVVAVLAVPIAAQAQFRQGGWSDEPTPRKVQILVMLVVFTIAVLGYVANRLLNPTRPSR